MTDNFIYFYTKNAHIFSNSRFVFLLFFLNIIINKIWLLVSLEMVTLVRVNVNLKEIYELDESRDSRTIRNVTCTEQFEQTHKSTSDVIFCYHSGIHCDFYRNR